MSDEKRTFELVETYSAPALKLKPRRLKGRDGQVNGRSGVPEVVSREDVRSSSTGFALSREIIMRLIDWLREE
jgi:hypothetical protein